MSLIEIYSYLQSKRFKFRLSLFDSVGFTLSSSYAENLRELFKKLTRSIIFQNKIFFNGFDFSGFGITQGRLSLTSRVFSLNPNDTIISIWQCPCCEICDYQILRWLFFFPENERTLGHPWWWTDSTNHPSGSWLCRTSSRFC